MLLIAEVLVEHLEAGLEDPLGDVGQQPIGTDQVQPLSSGLVNELLGQLAAGVSNRVGRRPQPHPARQGVNALFNCIGHGLCLPRRLRLEPGMSGQTSQT